MNKKNLNQGIVTIFLLGLSFTTQAQGTLRKNNLTNKPNIIFILVDDMGWKDLGVYGSTFYESPNLDKLAAQGMQFTDAYASSPVCSPSRSSIMTGQVPVNTGITDWIIGAQNIIGPMPDQKLIPQQFIFNLPKSNITIAQALKNNGYVTCFAGKWHLGMSEDIGPRQKVLIIIMGDGQPVIQEIMAWEDILALTTTQSLRMAQPANFCRID